MVSRLPVMPNALTLLVVMILAIPLVLPASADDVPSSNTLRKTIEDLLQQLDSPQLAIRTHAERNLLDLGPDVLTFLPAPELTPSIEVQQAIKRIRIPLERRAARESAQASRVTLHGDFTVTQVLVELTRQTRNRVELTDTAGDVPSKIVHVEFTNQLFWECLDQLCDQLKCESRFDPHRSALTLQSRSVRSSVPLLVQRTGPVRVDIQSVEVRPIAGNPANRLARVTARLALEPRLRPLFLHFAANDVLAFDATGQRLQAWNAAATYELPVGDAGREVPVQLDYLLPIENNTPSLELRGRLSMQLAAGTERIVFDQTSQVPNTSRRRGGVTVQLKTVQFESQGDGTLNAEVGVSVSYDTGGPAFESHRTWMFHNAVYMEAPMHRHVDFSDYDTTMQLNGSVGVDYRWERLASPATQYIFVYEAPTLILDLPVELKLDRVPITNPATK